MRAAIHQPNFLPWIGYFYKFYLADVFVFLDDAQFSKNSFINRNKIKTPQGEQWITLPIKSANKFEQKINEVKIDNRQKSVKKILSTVKMNYSKTKYFSEYFPEFEVILNNSNDNLVSLNIDLINWINKILDIHKKIVLSSECDDISGSATEKLIKICKKLNATTYFAGFGSSKYHDEDLFSASGIELRFYDFNHPIYPQIWGDFIPNLSIIDLLFNCGSESKVILNLNK